ncbi:hypothetical protein QQ045_022468 [Rhodiola kirilowii]
MSRMSSSSLHPSTTLVVRTTRDSITSTEGPLAVPGHHIRENTSVGQRILSTTSVCDPSTRLTLGSASQMVQVEPRAQRSKAHRIVDPALFYLQKVLGCAVFTRDNGVDKVSWLDLLVLDCFDRGATIDYAHLLCEFWEQRCWACKVVCGGFITYMLQKLHGEPTLHDHEISQTI